MIKIKVAIMGAGLSGLACARILEENGVTPTIFEKRSELGDRFVNCEILLSILSKPLDDIIKHLSDKYSIYLRPQSAIRKLIIHSENEKAEIKGNLGFTNLRGRTDNSFEKQLGT
ncbi:MAG TPA: NAD(P)-binding protein, partial [Halanaerobiales bacterium]|nr:NAD(P)-binding protein [Halanaerobiales bacterium]